VRERAREYTRTRQDEKPARTLRREVVAPLVLDGEEQIGAHARGQSEFDLGVGPAACGNAHTTVRLRQAVTPKPAKELLFPERNTTHTHTTEAHAARDRQPN
jgi:hypothetical protein